MMNKDAKRRKRNLRDSGIMIFCLVLAFFAWQGIRKNTGFEVMVSEIPVDVDVPDGWAVWEKSVNRVNIIFRGSREDIRYLNNDRLRIAIPINEPSRQDVIKIDFLEKYVRNPTDARVVRFSPSEIVIRLDREAEKKLPVKATMGGTLPDGVEVDRIVCTPASVRVIGAQKILDEMENIHTEPIGLDDRYQSFNESIPVAISPSGRMRVEPDWVSVDFLLVERSATHELKNIRVQLLCAPGEDRKISITPGLVNVVLKGRPEILEPLRGTDILAFISCTDLTENTGYNIPVRLDLPAGIQLVSTEPTAVHVEIETP